jgi:hypothetical protein
VRDEVSVVHAHYRDWARGGQLPRDRDLVDDVLDVGVGELERGPLGLGAFVSRVGSRARPRCRVARGEERRENDDAASQPRAHAVAQNSPIQ